MFTRFEVPADIKHIRSVVTDAFKHAPHSDGTEATIVDALRESGALTVSLVAEDQGEIIGHVAFSPVRIDGAAVDWCGLGPLAVRPDKQQSGVGTALIMAGLTHIKALNARGCVVLGDPAYYGRFGFASDPALCFADVPPEYFQCLIFAGERPHGVVDYHPAFFVGQS
jgi:putative acetyltransferase